MVSARCRWRLMSAQTYGQAMSVPQEVQAPTKRPSPPGGLELAAIISVQAMLIALLGAGPTNGFGVFHAPEHDLYPPLIVGGVIDLAAFAAAAYWVLPAFTTRRNVVALFGSLASVLLGNVALQVASQTALIALMDHAPKTATLADLVVENSYGAAFVLLFSALYRFSADWLKHWRHNAGMTARITGLEADVAGMQEKLAVVGNSGLAFIDLGHGKAARRFSSDEILYLKAAGNYTEVTTRFQTYTLYGTLKALGSQLPAAQFARTHRSFLVNLRHVRALTSAGAVLDGATLPVGAQQRTEAMRRWRAWGDATD
jgi:DNA-binding LytR/AlgR family response regulator